jgi:formiminotetrahydrofolate cyclodeaminase
MRTDTIETFLGQLAARVPAPGGGATAGLHAAQAAALVAMVARYSDSAKFAEHAEEIATIKATADRLRENALALAEEDAAAFTAVTQAYGLPKETPDEAAARSAAIAQALVAAAHVPAIVIAVAEQVLGLAEQLLPIGNRNVISDVAAAAEAARAAATTARVNVEINLGGIKDPVTWGELAAVVDTVDDLVLRAEKVTAAVRDGLVR